MVAANRQLFRLIQALEQRDRGNEKESQIPNIRQIVGTGGRRTLVSIEGDAAAGSKSITNEPHMRTRTPRRHFSRLGGGQRFHCVSFFILTAEACRSDESNNTGEN